MAGRITRDPISGAIQLNLYATGPKHYGANGSTTATTGPVEKAGYAERERNRRLRQRAVQRRLKLAQPYDGDHLLLGGD